MSTRMLERVVSQGWGEAVIQVWRPTPAPSPRRMTYEEFLDWADEDTLAEWVDGEVIMTSPASRRHQEIALFLTQLMSSFVEHRGLGKVLPPPFQMKLPDSGREPDLIFIAAEHLYRLRENRLEGPGDVVVEIVSPESEERDREVKLREYEEAGVPEYWIVDPLRRSFEAYVLDEEGEYRLVFHGEEGEYCSQHLPGFWLRVEWLWQQPPPSVLDVLLEVGGDEFAGLLIERLRERGFLPRDEGG